MFKIGPKYRRRRGPPPRHLLVALLAFAGIIAIATIERTPMNATRAAIRANTMAEEVVATALSPILTIPATAQDDSAGDALVPNADIDRAIRVPEPLTDERVVAAFGPLINLSCHKNDPPGSDGLGEKPADPTARSAPALNAPLASNAPDDEQLRSQPLIAAAVSPVARIGRAQPGAIDASATQAASDVAVAQECPPLLHYTFNKLQTGEPQSMCQFEGKVLLVVNTASYCGYTHQYEALEAIYRKYRDRGLVVVGFPSNDFGGQEPGSNGEIAEFCRSTYGVQFPMFEKGSVSKINANPLFVELAAKTGKAPRWNFHKYLIDRNGVPVASFASAVTPDDPELVSLIERLLAQKPGAPKVVGAR